ncbi:MAG TPA: N-acetylmuramoyl-L-alanine amidase [Geobacteraceae bacterium]|nr:N-acetylmuramoyl-L-alanine amidase [Geobacteraceae bacterium]
MKAICRTILIFASCALVLALVPRLSFAEEKEPGRKTAAGTSSAQKQKKAGKAKKKKADNKPPAKAVANPGRQATVVPAEKPGNQSSATALVKEMRHWSNPDYTRIAVTLDREAKFEIHQLPPLAGATTPPRIYIDIASARIAHGVRDIPIGDGLLKTARIGQFKPDTVRVVLDMDNIKDYKVFTFSDPFRIIIDVKGERRAELSRPQETVIAPLPAPAIKPEREEEKPKIPARPVIGKIRRIVVDAGHGGHDPGASGAGGTKEKDIVLEIALRLARHLREDLGLDVVLTRSTDVFLELQERTAIANQVGADLFVSVHANASLNRGASGIETYYLNLAKTEKAAQLAAKENGTSLEKVSLLQAVLFDLMANYKLNDSALLAEEVQKSLHRKVGGQYPGVKNLGVKQGPFYVLVGATMPSILVETAFLSNEKEEEHLTDPRYQEKTAEGIAEGIRNYITAVK